MSMTSESISCTKGLRDRMPNKDPIKMHISSWCRATPQIWQTWADQVKIKRKEMTLPRVKQRISLLSLVWIRSQSELHTPKQTSVGPVKRNRLKTEYAPVASRTIETSIISFTLTVLKEPLRWWGSNTRQQHSFGSQMRNPWYMTVKTTNQSFWVSNLTGTILQIMKTNLYKVNYNKREI